MELLEGESLRARLDQGPLAPRRAIHSALDVAFALQNVSLSEVAAPLSVSFAPQNRRATRLLAVFSTPPMRT